MPYSALEAFLARQAGGVPPQSFYTQRQEAQTQPNQQGFPQNQFSNVLGRYLQSGMGSSGYSLPSSSFFGGGGAGASFAPTGPSLSGSAIPSIGGTYAPTFAGSSGGAAGGSGGAGAAGLINPWTALAAAIAANEITAHGTDRRPGGTLDQIGFDLMGKAPAADINALSDKWNLGQFGNVLEGSAKVGASVDPRDWWKGTKQVTNSLGNLLGKIF